MVLGQRHKANKSLLNNQTICSIRLVTCVTCKNTLTNYSVLWQGFNTNCDEFLSAIDFLQLFLGPKTREDLSAETVCQGKPNGPSNTDAAKDFFDSSNFLNTYASSLTDQDII